MNENFMLNIVYIITRSDVLGGASVHLLDLAKGYAKHTFFLF